MPNGRPLLYGRLCVQQTSTKLRMIFDGRVPSQGEERLRWMRLPHGCLFCKLRRPPWLSVRGSGGDLRCWFYQVAEFEANMCRRGFGRSFTGKAAAARGLDPKSSV